MVSVNTSPRKRGLRNMLLHTRTFVITLGDFRYGIRCSGMRSRDDAANPGKNHMPKTGTRGEELHRRLRRINFSWAWKDVLQRPSKKCANIGEQDPGIAWEKSQARAGRNFSQPRTIYLISRSVYFFGWGNHSNIPWRACLRGSAELQKVCPSMGHRSESTESSASPVRNVDGVRDILRSDKQEQRRTKQLNTIESLVGQYKKFSNYIKAKYWNSVKLFIFVRGKCNILERLVHAIDRPSLLSLSPRHTSVRLVHRDQLWGWSRRKWRSFACRR